MTRLSRRSQAALIKDIEQAAITQREIAQRYGVSLSTVRRYAYENGLTKTNHRWTPEEDEIIRRFYKTKGPRELAETAFAKTHPNPLAVCQRARVLGVARRIRRKGEGDEFKE